MKQIIQVFKNELFGALRVAEKNGKEWFCLNDVCKALELKNPRMVKDRLAERGVSSMDTPTSNQYGTLVMQKVNFIDEANLYRCIFQSRKEEAEQFQDWVFEEVLPQLRKKSAFRVDDSNQPLLLKELQQALEEAQQELADTRKELAILEEQMDDLEADANYAQLVLQSKGTLTATQIAKEMDMSAKAMNKMLHEMGIIFKQSGEWQLYAPYHGRGLVAKETLLPDGAWYCPRRMRWTEEGHRFLNETISDHKHALLPQLKSIQLTFNFTA